MTTYLLAGGGTAGHVNPLLAVADGLRARQPDAVILALGTESGLEARLVPARGYELLTVEKVPFPRKPNATALRFPGALVNTVRAIRRMIRERHVDVVVGFGGYVSAPAYVAARSEGVPLVIHEANAKPGMANRLGSWLSPYVGVTFPGTPLRHAQEVGMPLRAEIETLDIAAVRPVAYQKLGLSPSTPTLLVTGGSLGAAHINNTVDASADAVIAAGWQVLHIRGGGQSESSQLRPGHVQLEYCDAMAEALAVADFAVSRAGSSTVSELTALEIPALYVPLAIGNGEQKKNCADIVGAGGALMVDNAEFTSEWVARNLIPLLADTSRVAAMRDALTSRGRRDGTARTIDLIDLALTGRN